MTERAEHFRQLVTNLTASLSERMYFDRLAAIESGCSKSVVLDDIPINVGRGMEISLSVT